MERKTTFILSHAEVVAAVWSAMCEKHGMAIDIHKPPNVIIRSRDVSSPNDHAAIMEFTAEAKVIETL